MNDNPELRAFVRAQIDEMAGDQIRGATEDGVRLGFGMACTMADGLVASGECSPEQVAVLSGLAAALRQASAQFTLIGPLPGGQS